MTNSSPSKMPPVSSSRHFVLPSPPSDEEKFIYVSRKLPVLLVSSAFSISCLTFSQVYLIRLRPWLWIFVPFLALTLFQFLIAYVLDLPSRNFDLKTHQSLVAAWTPNHFPSVDIWLPICGEDIAVLANTWLNVDRLAKEYPGQVNVYVLDDGEDSDAATMAASYEFNYLVRRNRGWMKKAGNLRNAFENSSGEFIAIFDADFAPRSDFLAETVPYMQKNPSLGIVQTPQFFRQDKKQTWMERGAGAVQESFYRVVQVSRDAFDGAICVGSCGLYRRTALDSTGGTTLIEHSEDVHTGFDVYQHGWGLRYIPIALATGISPQGPDSFLTQQYRWCDGSMSLLGARKFWDAKLRLSTRFCYLSGFLYYIQTAFATFVISSISIVMLIFLPRIIELHNYFWIAPSLFYTLVIFPLWNTGRYGPASLMTKSLYGWAHFFALMDIVRGRRKGWQATGASTRRPTRRIWLAIIIWGGSTTIAWVSLAIYRMTTMRPINFVVLLGVGIIYGWTTTIMPLLAKAQSARQ